MRGASRGSASRSPAPWRRWRRRSRRPSAGSPAAGSASAAAPIGATVLCRPCGQIEGRPDRAAPAGAPRRSAAVLPRRGGRGTLPVRDSRGAGGARVSRVAGTQEDFDRLEGHGRGSHVVSARPARFLRGGRRARVRPSRCIRRPRPRHRCSMGRLSTPDPGDSTRQACAKVRAVQFSHGRGLLCGRTPRSPRRCAEPPPASTASAAA